MLAVADADPLLGQILGGRYVIEALIGEGGLGRVYRARHVQITRRYAVKVPFGDVAGDDRLRRRFAQEAEAAGRLEHPNLVHVLDVGETDAGLLYLVMDFVDGQSLARSIARGPMPAAAVARLIGQIAAGLGHAHDRGLVHRDLKPDNVLVVASDHGPVARIVDFGIAIFRDDDASRVTTQGIVMGTPHYMAPEQATGGKLDARTDLFALGVILYELLAGVLPFEGAAIDIARQHLAVTPPPIATRVPGLAVDPALEALAFWLMAKQPADRPPDAATVVEAVALIAHDPAGARRMLDARRSSGEPAPDGDRLTAPTSVAAFEALPTLREVSIARVRARSRGPLIGLLIAIAIAVVAIVVVATRSPTHRTQLAGAPAITSLDAGASGSGSGSGSGSFDSPLADARGSLRTVGTPERDSATDSGSDSGSGSGSASIRSSDPRPPPHAGASSDPSPRGKGGPHAGRTADADADPVPADAGTRPAAPDRDTPPPPPPPPVDAAGLKRRYAAVGERLNRALADGDARAPALRTRYGALPFLQALGDPAEAARVERELRAIDRVLATPP